jgi:hypothetical protein
MTTAGLDNLPTELFEWILRYCTLDSICSLRRTSRSLNIKSTQDAFRSRFRNVRLDIKKGRMETFAAIAKSPLGANVE